MLIEGVDYFVRLVDFPNCKCNGAVALNDDGTFSVYINSKASDAQKKKAMQHEICHMVDDDFYGDKDIRSIEKV